MHPSSREQLALAAEDVDVVGSALGDAHRRVEHQPVDRTWLGARGLPAPVRRETDDPVEDVRFKCVIVRCEPAANAIRKRQKNRAAKTQRVVQQIDRLVIEQPSARLTDAESAGGHEGRVEERRPVALRAISRLQHHRVHGAGCCKRQADELRESRLRPTLFHL